jgi:MYXO-CTERM domain-containing protein
MRTYSIVTSCGLLAAVMSSVAQAAVVQYTFNLNQYAGGPPNLVGIAAKINSGSASMQSITGAQVANSSGTIPQAYGLPSGWSQQTLASPFTAGSSTASSSQYGFVRGGGGSTNATADTYNTGTGGGIGYTVTCLLDAGYTPLNGQTINLITVMFRQVNTSSASPSDPYWLNGYNFFQTNSMFTYNGTTSVWDRTTTLNNGWDEFTSGTFDQFSAAVVPAPGALALLGVAGLAGGRRRRA